MDVDESILTTVISSYNSYVFFVRSINNQMNGEADNDDSRNWWPISDRHQAHDGLCDLKPRRVSRACLRFERTPLIIPQRNYVPLVNLIGVFFQIRDDYFNLQSKEVMTLSPSSRVTEVFIDHQ